MPNLANPMYQGNQQVQDHQNMVPAVAEEHEKVNVRLQEPAQQNQNKKKSLEDNPFYKMFDDDLSEIPMEENSMLVEEGIKLFGEMDEHEILLNDVLEGMGEIKRPPIRVKVNRLKREMAQKNNLEIQQKPDAIQAKAELDGFRNRLVKQGRFTEADLRNGDSFLKKIDTWAGKSQNPSIEESSFYDSVGSSNTLDFLYVDGIPLKDFVRKNYDYRGGLEGYSHRVLSAYAAMITARKNHAITMVRPVMKDGVADVDIRNLDVVQVSKNDSRSKKVDAIRYRNKGREWEEYCKTAYRSTKMAEAGSALRTSQDRSSQSLSQLQMLNYALQRAGKGSHQNYDDFVSAFHKYFDALALIGSDVDNMVVDMDTVIYLDRLSYMVIQTANSYLKGKNMKLDRHKAVQNIRDLLSIHSGRYLGARHSLENADKNTTIPLTDILDKQDEGFVVAGIEAEINQRQKDQKINRNDRNEYETINEGFHLNDRQKVILELKNIILSDNEVSQAYSNYLNAMKDPRSKQNQRRSLGIALLKASSKALLNNEKYGSSLRDRHGRGVKDPEILQYQVAEKHISNLLSNIFSMQNELNASLNLWGVNLAAKEAQKLNYQNNVLGNQISEEDFQKYGGSSRHFYVTEREASEILLYGQGYLMAKKVPGNKFLREIRPSMPEYTMLRKGQPSQERIPLRKTMNLMFKAFTNLLLDENGKLKDEGHMPRFKDYYAVEMIETLLDQDPSNIDDSQEEFQEFLEQFIQPTLEELLKKEYAAKGMSKKLAEKKAKKASREACQNYTKIVEGNTHKMAQSSDASPAFLWKFSAYMKRINQNRQDFMNIPEVKDIRIDGKAPSEEEINQVLDEFSEELRRNTAELKEIRDMDEDSEETVCINSCIDNASFLNAIMSSHTSSQNQMPYTYISAEKLKNNLPETIEFLYSHRQQLVDNAFIEKNKPAKLELIERLYKVFKEKGELTENQMSMLAGFYIETSKYESHDAANVSKVGNDIITIETYAADPSQIFNATFTRNAHIGRYRSDKPTENMYNGKLKHDGLNQFYNHDDYFAFSNTRLKILKCRLKDIIGTKANKTFV
ncbi:MAG: hypothetical protein K5989_07910 [Lachnospiraceae bacterium]|nr:hypothetical protein [Lachnospiraceae bacterium]